jgi:hypothetical protein
VTDDVRAIEPDREFTGERPTEVVRARYAIVLPDEHSTLTTERALTADDQGDRLLLQLVGAALPVVPGMHVAARAGLTGFALTTPGNDRYRAISPDELQRWFLGASSRADTIVAFRRTDQTVLATRGSLSLLINTDADGGLHPLLCRALVAIMLGGDPEAAHVGCANARLARRATLRAHGWSALSIERTQRDLAQRPRDALAVPPADATPDMPLPAHASTGAFFAPAELASLPGSHRAQDILTITSGLGREALVFVDDLAIGWLGAGETAAFVGLSAGRHAVRARSLDGIERTRAMTVTFPATVRIENAPELR